MYVCHYNMYGISRLNDHWLSQVDEKNRCYPIERINYIQYQHNLLYSKAEFKPYYFV